MLNYLFLQKTPLFFAIDGTDLPSLLSCLNAVEKTFEKGTFVFRRGEPVPAMGLVLTGTVHIINEDFWGNRTIVGHASPGQLFGETYATLHGTVAEVSVMAMEHSTLLFLDVKRLCTTCSSACAFHTRLIGNLLGVLAEKNLMLTRKMEHMSKKTTREKLLSYLSAQSIAHKSPIFQIPFNRQQLAEYLAVDRSAMSTELSKLREEGFLTFEKNKFTLKETLPPM